MLKVKSLRVDYEGVAAVADADYLVYFFSASPFFGIAFLSDNYIFKPGNRYLFPQQVFLAVNVILAALMSYLAFRQRRRIKSQIFSRK